MAQITLEYDARNAFMKSYLNTALLAGFKVIHNLPATQKELTPFEKSLEDMQWGRVSRVKNISNLLQECMQ